MKIIVDNTDPFNTHVKSVTACCSIMAQTLFQHSGTAIRVHHKSKDPNDLEVKVDMHLWGGGGCHIENKRSVTIQRCGWCMKDIEVEQLNAEVPHA